MDNLTKMQTDGIGWLKEQLRTTPPAAVAELADQDLRKLGDALRAQRKRQGEALTAASDKALESIPRLLRGPVKKLVG